MLGSRVPEDGLVLLLSGTPIMNRPAELLSQLAILDRLKEFGGGSEFLTRYCKPSSRVMKNPRTGKLMSRVVTDGADNLDELNRKLRRSCFLRRTKDQVLKELPPKVRTTLWVDGDPDQMKAYWKAEADVIRYLADRARELARQQGTDPQHAAESAAWRAQAAEHLVQISTLRQLSALAKLPAVVEWLENSSEPVVVFVHHRSVAEALLQRFDCPAIRGGMSAEESQAAVDAFQAGDARLIVCSIQAAGVGLTLTAASDVIFVEQAWTPAALEQAEDRLHRIGQANSVTAWYAAIDGTIDQLIFDLLRAKRQVIHAAMEGGDQSIASDLVAALTRKGLSQ